MKKKYNITCFENPHHIFASNNKSKGQKGPNRPADFEDAITACGYGKFNIMVLFMMIPPAFAVGFSTTTMAYVFPIAQCDLDLSLDDKGLMNSVTYIGMITSGFIFGYLTDAIGRRKLIMYVYIIDGLLVTLCGLSQKYIPLLVVKFLAGFVVNGGYAAYIAYANEFHAAKYRPFVAIYNGIVMNLCTIIMPFLGWLIFTDKINTSLFGDYIVIRSWNVFLFVCSIPSFLASLLYTFMPESPKFLMSRGKNKEALKVFSKVYSMNTGLSPDTYPVRVLIDEKPQIQDAEESNSKQQSCIQPLSDGCHESKTLLHKPYCFKLLLVLLINFGYLFGLNTLRLWLPQLFITIYDFDKSENPKEFDLCSSLETLTVSNSSGNSTCTVNYDNKSVYIYILICGVAITGILLISVGLVSKMSKKFVLIVSGCISGGACIMIYFSQNLTMLIVSFTLHIGFIYVISNVLMSVVVNVFPTRFRALTIALTMVAGRSGSAIGNITFPMLLATKCIYPFATIGCLVTVVSFLTILLPDTDLTPLQ